MTRMVEVHNCGECPYCQCFGRQYHCDELGRDLKSPTLRIPKDCPLDSGYFLCEGDTE